MASALEIKKRLLRLNEQRVRAVVSNLIINSDNLKEAKKNEFRKGIKPNGEIIGTYKNFSYQQRKLKKNPLAGGNVDLILTGSFTNNLIIKRKSKDSYFFDSTDKKSPFLFNKYGEEIRGLNQETFKKVWNLHINRLYILELKKITGL